VPEFQYMTDVSELYSIWGYYNHTNRITLLEAKH